MEQRLEFNLIMEIKRNYQKQAVTATTIRALVCRIHPLWNSTEGNTAVFPEICFMFPETKDEIQSFDFQLTIDKHMQRWQLLFRAIEERKRRLKVKTGVWPQPAAHPLLSKDSTMGAGLRHPPAIWGNFPLTSSLGWSFICALLQGLRICAPQEAHSIPPM